MHFDESWFGAGAGCSPEILHTPVCWPTAEPSPRASQPGQYAVCLQCQSGRSMPGRAGPNWQAGHSSLTVTRQLAAVPSHHDTELQTGSPKYASTWSKTTKIEEMSSLYRFNPSMYTEASSSIYRKVYLICSWGNIYTDKGGKAFFKQIRVGV